MRVFLYYASLYYLINKEYNIKCIKFLTKWQNWCESGSYFFWIGYQLAHKFQEIFILALIKQGSDLTELWLTWRKMESLIFG